MNVRKPVDYSTMYRELTAILAQNLPQMEEIYAIGKGISQRPEKGAAVAAAKFLQANFPDRTGFSPRNVRRMRDFYKVYENDEPLLRLAMKIGWTLNVVIMEAELTRAQRISCLQRAGIENLSKKKLLEIILNDAFEEEAIDERGEICYNITNSSERNAEQAVPPPKQYEKRTCGDMCHCSSRNGALNMELFPKQPQAILDELTTLENMMPSYRAELINVSKFIRNKIWGKIDDNFSIVDVVAVLTDQPDQRGASNYWAKLKQRLKEEGADQLLTNCQQLKMKSPKDGKRYNTDVADTEQLLRIIQSIPSPKAEPFKLWLAQVGRERIEETIDPELTIDRALETYLKKGYSREWINQHLQAIQVRKELTDEWDARGVQKGVEYAILTDEITKAWSGMNTRQYKNLKGLKKENLRDNMTTLELVLNMLAEATTTEISRQKAPEGLRENVEVARSGGKVAGDARKAIEQQTGVPVITSKNAAQLNQVVTNLLESAEIFAE